MYIFDQKPSLLPFQQLEKKKIKKKKIKMKQE